MTRKELKKLNRKQLLELLLIQTEELEELNSKIAELKDKLAKRELEMSETGNIAEASLKLSGIFEAAQAAADIYLENIKKLSDLNSDGESVTEAIQSSDTKEEDEGESSDETEETDLTMESEPLKKPEFNITFIEETKNEKN